MNRRLQPSFDNPWFVTTVFLAVALAITWPLATVLGTEVAGDLGDPLLNCWIMMWTGGQVLRFLRGDWHALADYWNGNIFYPERLTIAYSEHLTPQMLQILPVWAVTHNIVLCYNLLFLATMVLSALGMYLFVREFTRQPVAAFIAGLVFMCAPYRMYQVGHLQVISTQWALFGFFFLRRYFDTGRARALVAGVGSIVLQVLSCGYYLFYFVPFLGAYVLYEVHARRRWRDALLWRQLVAAAIAGLIALTPFLIPYLKVRAQAGFGVRPLEEVIGFSADTWAYATVYEGMNLYGLALQTFVRGEAKLFPGITILLLTLAGIGVVAWRARRSSRTLQAPTPRQRVLGVVLAVLGVALTAAWAALLTIGPFTTYLGSLRIAVRDVWPLAPETALVFAVALCLPRVRAFFAGMPRSIGGFLIAGFVISLVLTLGPEIHVHGHAIGGGPYQWLYDFVPGFNGMRVPARFFMITTCFMAALSGVAIAATFERSARAGVIISLVAGTLVVAEGASWPFRTNARLFLEHFDLESRDLAPSSHLGPVYDTVTQLPGSTVLLEFPYGAFPYDIRSVYYSGFHRKPLLNGYSGFYPASFNSRLPTLGWNPTENADAAWKTMRDSGATHVVVHEAAYFDEKGKAITAWLRDSGARELAVDGTDHLFALPDRR